MRLVQVQTILSMLALSFLFVACSDDEAASGDTDVTSDIAFDVALPDAEDVDLVDRDLAGDPSWDRGVDGEEPERRGFGEQCTSNLECLSGYCVASAMGFVCTDICLDGECPTLDGDPMVCRSVVNFGLDVVMVCLPMRQSICAPCLNDTNCLDGSCVGLPAGGQVCGRDCSETMPCPEGTFCFASIPGVGNLERSQCLPNNLTCDCTESTAGDTRPCARSNDEGTRTCVGEETCDPIMGWMGCDARTPEPEVCDGTDNDCNGIVDDVPLEYSVCQIGAAGQEHTCPGILRCFPEEQEMRCVGTPPQDEVCDLRDNDCDGSTDEDFKSGDLYTHQEHCGTCNNSCADLFPESFETACEVHGGQAVCVVTGCPPGFVVVGLHACVPLSSSLCSPCEVDDDCRTMVGDSCLEYSPTESYCGRDCGPDSLFGEICPSGYHCDEGELQCRLDSGSCICGPGDDFNLPCEFQNLADPEVICAGIRHCFDGTLSECVPPEESCDGFDNNCSGSIDDGFLNPVSGYYDLQPAQHCGRCYNDCSARYSEEIHNATGECLLGDGPPSCVLVCSADELGQWVDANGLEYDGCECHRAWGVVTDVPNGRDENCDGMDGDVARGVFVARYGSDISGDGSRENPLATIQSAIEMAAAYPALDHVYVSAGVYRESLLLSQALDTDGVSLYGGYSYDFSRRDIAGNETAIIGQEPTAELLATVNVEGIDTYAVVIDGFTLVGYDQTAPAKSSYVVHILNSDHHLRLTHNVIRAAHGGSGVPGVYGQGGLSARTGTSGYLPAVVGGSAALANAGDTLDPRCPGANDTNSVAGGDGARFECFDHAGDPRPTDGGVGGTADCPYPNKPEPAGALGTATPGGGPDRPMTAGGSGGAGGYSFVLDTRFQNQRRRNPPRQDCYWCIVPSDETATIDARDGSSGLRGDDGTPGVGCRAAPGEVQDGAWTAGEAPTYGQGAAGLRGGAGSGGGGGGAGGGAGHCGPEGDCPLDPSITYPICEGSEIVGGGGGGGGAGGCGGAGGTGGGPGGGSFGVFIIFDASASLSTLPLIGDNQVFRGRGGVGGDGGPGGDGGLGSEGAESSPPSGGAGCSGVGGRGGRGGPGGAGGGGGGGCGGISTGVYVFNSPASTESYLAQNQFPPSGGGGFPGRGGPSTGYEGEPAESALYEPVLPCPGGEEPPCESSEEE